MGITGLLLEPELTLKSGVFLNTVPSYSTKFCYMLSDLASFRQCIAVAAVVNESCRILLSVFGGIDWAIAFFVPTHPFVGIFICT